MKRNLWFFCLLIIAGNVLSPLSSKSQDTPKKYNVIFISTHDMTDRVGFLGKPGPFTPNFERLAAHGMVFYNNNCQYPVSSPARTSLLSGWRPDKTGIFGNGVRPRSVMGDEVNFLPEYFHQFGYRTERYGIVMLSQWEGDIQWDYAFNDSVSFFKPLDEIPHSESQQYKGGDWWINSQPDSSNIQMAHTNSYISRLQQPISQPFFYALGYVQTHNPFQPSLENWNKNGDPSVQEYLPDKHGDTTAFIGNGSGNIILPQTPLRDRSDVPPIAFAHDAIVKTDDDWRKTIHAYDGDATQLDAYLGLVLDEIDRQNLWQNSIVIFWVDHGQHLGEHEGTWLKETLFEESQHIPLIICVPGKKPGVCYNLTENVDIYPTLAELCNLPKPSGMEGTSLAPLIDNPAFTWKRAIFSQVGRKEFMGNPEVMGRTVRTQKYRYNFWEGYGEELYNHDVDPFEYTNLADNINYQEALNEMRTILAEGWEKSLPPVYPLLTFYRDRDNDGFGSAVDSTHAYAVLSGYVANNTDCNDNNAAINPGATEICDGLDNNCDGNIDEGVVAVSITPFAEVSICKNNSVTLVASPTSGASLQWLRNLVPLPGAIQNNYTADSAGNYQVIATVNNLCSDTSAITSVNIINPPAAKITAKGNLDICLTGSALLRANNGNGLTYQWKKDNKNISGATSRDYTATTTGAFKVQVTNTTGCKKTSTAVTVTKSCFASSSKSIEQARDNYESILTVAPNPNSGKVKVNFISRETGQVYLKVYNAQGKELIRITESCVTGLNGYQLNLSRLSSGTYFLELSSKRTVARKMMIIQK